MPEQKPNAPAFGQRYEQLDALRGLAAFTVVTFHLQLVLGLGGLWRLTPLACGLEAVRFFFILSGFVLALPFLRGKVAVLPFLVKRVARIWPPYAVALLVSAGLLVLFHEKNAALLADGGLWLQHALLIGNYDVDAINPVIWSLLYEMRLSLVFPLLMALVLRLRSRHMLLLTLAASILGVYGDRLLVKLHLANNWPITLHFGAMFAVGVLLAQHREALVARWCALKPIARAALLSLAGVAYTLAFQLAPHLFPGILYYLLEDWVVVAAAALMLVAALAPGRLQTLLRHPALRYLGAISYSLYLYHEPIVYALGYRVIGIQPAWELVLVALTLSFGAATLSYHLVERPAIAGGRALSARLEAWIRRPAPVLPGAEEAA